MHRNVKYGVDDEEVFYKLDGIKGLACFAEVSISMHVWDLSEYMF